MDLARVNNGTCRYKLRILNVNCFRSFAHLKRHGVCYPYNLTTYLDELAIGVLITLFLLCIDFM